MRTENCITERLLKAAEESENSSISFAERRFSDREKTTKTFADSKIRILDIEEWNKHSKLSSYRLFDESGQELENQLISEGVFNRILLKGSGKYDWVKVIAVHETADEKVITVKPTFDPTVAPPDKTATSHFFTSESTNNFCLLKNGRSISLYVIGLVEKQNIDEAKNTIEAVRNVAAANIGSYLGIQKSEWETFCKNFLEAQV